MMMQLSGATASHVGNVRESNQDRAHFGGYVAAVADGMGGHQGGEMAATIAISEFSTVADPLVPGGLVEIVEDANRAVFERAADPELRGMGTTLVALTLRPSEEKVSVVNVGDSRAYHLRGDQFKQLTLDHSLVEDLVRGGRLTPDQAANHPQRNILTRALGIASVVEVDRFLLNTQVGDRFLLCSDGLFNEVSHEEIIRLLKEYEHPGEAANALVEAALEGPARDNVTVAVVDVVPDGEGGDLTIGPKPTMEIPVVGNGGSSRPTPTAEAQTLGIGPMGGVGLVELDNPSDAMAGGVPGGVQHPITDVVPAITIEEEPAVIPDVDVDDDMAPRRRRRRRRLPMIAASVALLALLALGGYLGATWYARQTWFVDNVDGQLAVFNGRPGGFLWLSPSEEMPLEIEADQLTTEAITELEERPTFNSQAEAEVFAQGLEQQVQVDVGDLPDAPDVTSTTAISATTNVAPDIEDDTTTTTAGG
ncbi:MAG: PP2C family serine/threonine-protein phosphatase [Actinomycetota bacterium]